MMILTSCTVIYAEESAGPFRIVRYWEEHSTIKVIPDLPSITLTAGSRSRDYAVIPFNISFWPGFSIGESLARGRKIINQFSINVLAGSAARLQGIEFGSVWNDYTEDIQGLQFSGVANTVRGSGVGLQCAGVVNLMGDRFRGVQASGVVNVVDGLFYGMQNAGVANLVRGRTEGFQAAGVTNLVYDAVQGVQAGGVFNLAYGTVEGAQIAGVVNLAGGSVSGVQVGGVYNHARGDFTGVQVGGVVNITEGSLEGLQVAGVINVADEVADGVQIGVINVANEQRGLPIGLVTIARNRPYMRFEVSAGEVFLPRFSFKLGVDYFYNIYSLGKLPGDRNRWAYGAGFGTEIPLRSFITLNIEGMTHQELWIDEERARHFLYTDRVNLLNQLKFILGLRLSRRLALFIGPTFNVLVEGHNKDRDDLAGSIAPSWTVFERDALGRRNRDVKAWVGFSAGVRF